MAVLLLGTFSKEPEFRADGLIVIDDGKVMFSTTGTVPEEPLNKHVVSIVAAGGSGGAVGGKKTTNTRISYLIERLRAELRENVLKRKIADPSYALENNKVVQAVTKLLATDGMG
eukprot:g13536.t1